MKETIRPRGERGLKIETKLKGFESEKQGEIKTILEGLLSERVAFYRSLPETSPRQAQRRLSEKRFNYYLNQSVRVWEALNNQRDITGLSERTQRRYERDIKLVKGLVGMEKYGPGTPPLEPSEEEELVIPLPPEAVPVVDVEVEEVKPGELPRVEPVGTGVERVRETLSKGWSCLRERFQRRAKGQQAERAGGLLVRLQQRFPDLKLGDLPERTREAIHGLVIDFGSPRLTRAARALGMEFDEEDLVRIRENQEAIDARSKESWEEVCQEHGWIPRVIAYPGRAVDLVRRWTKGEFEVKKRIGEKKAKAIEFVGPERYEKGKRIALRWGIPFAIGAGVFVVIVRSPAAQEQVYRLVNGGQTALSAWAKELAGEISTSTWRPSLDISLGERLEGAKEAVEQAIRQLTGTGREEVRQVSRDLMARRTAAEHFKALRLREAALQAREVVKEPEVIEEVVQRGRGVAEHLARIRARDASALARELSAQARAQVALLDKAAEVVKPTVEILAGKGDSLWKLTERLIEEQQLVSPETMEQYGNQILNATSRLFTGLRGDSLIRIGEKIQLSSEMIKQVSQRIIEVNQAIKAAAPEITDVAQGGYGVAQKLYEAGKITKEQFETFKLANGIDQAAALKYLMGL